MSKDIEHLQCGVVVKSEEENRLILRIMLNIGGRISEHMDINSYLLTGGFPNGFPVVTLIDGRIAGFKQNYIPVGLKLYSISGFLDTFSKHTQQYLIE